MPDNLISAVALKSFTSLYGNHAQGDKLSLTQHRFNVWKAQGLVDSPKGQKPAAQKVEAPVETPAPTPAPAPKGTGKRKGKRGK